MTVSYRGKIQFDNKNTVKLYNLSDWAKKGFAVNGSHLFYHLKGTVLYYIVAWLFNNLQNLNFDHQAYID